MRIEFALFGIIGQEHGNLGGALDLRLGARQGRQHGLFGQGVEMIGPALRIADDGDFEGRGYRHGVFFTS
ncbi:hypothetical protein D3C87_2094120 [compost metagenome]